MITNNIINSIPEGTNGFLKEIIKIVFKNSAVDMGSEQTIASFVGSRLYLIYYNLGATFYLVPSHIFRIYNTQLLTRQIY